MPDLDPGVDLPENRRPKFRRHTDIPKLAAGQAERQGRIVGRAMHWLGNGQNAMAFLNAHSQKLDGRPIDIAIASADGFDAVEAILSTVARPRAEE